MLTTAEKNGLQHVKRMDRARIPKQILPHARTVRLPGRPNRRWMEVTKHNTGMEDDDELYKDTHNAMTITVLSISHIHLKAKSSSTTLRRHLVGQEV
jgi:hypothetical protein